MNTIEKRAVSFREFRKETEHKMQGMDDSFQKTWAYGAALKEPLYKNHILYEWNQGTEVKGIYDFFRQKEDCSGFVHIWSVQNKIKKKAEQYLKQEQLDDQVILVQRGSAKYYDYLAKAEQLVCKGHFVPGFYKRPEQKLIYAGNPQDAYDWRVYHQADEAVDFHQKKQEKKKILVYCNFSNKSDFEIMDLLTMLDYADYGTYEITLVSPSFYQVSQFLLDAIHPEIHRCDFSGRLPYDREEYIWHNYLVKYLMNADDVMQITSFEQPCMRLYQKNHHRIWGNQVFDFALYYGNLTNADYLFFSQIQAMKKHYIRYESHREEQLFHMVNDQRKHYFQNRCKIYKSFDQIYCIGNKLFRENREAAPEIYENAIKLEHKLPVRHFLGNRFQKTVYRRKVYDAMEISEKSAGKVRMIFLPDPKEDQESLLFVLRNVLKEQWQEILNLLCRYQSQHVDAGIYIVDNDEILEEMMWKKVKDNVEKVHLLKKPILTAEYIEQFSDIISK